MDLLSILFNKFPGVEWSTDATDGDFTERQSRQPVRLRVYSGSRPGDLPWGAQNLKNMLEQLPLLK